jgi:RNA polymerase sigma factor (sigma-70 family)
MQELRAGDAMVGHEAHALAVRQLFEKHHHKLISFLTARLHSVQEAHDVAQEAYVRLLQLDDPPAISFLRSYLFRIAANLAIDRLREKASRNASDSQAPIEWLVDERDPDRTAIAEQQLEAVRAAILDLPANVRRAFVWHVFGGESTARIGARLKLTDRMIRLYIAQGLAACRARMDS